MNELQVIKGVECFIDNAGIVQLNLEHVARGLGFTQTAKSGNEVVRWERVERYLVDCGIPTSGDAKIRPQFIPEPIFYLLAMKADNQTARDFQKAVAYDILPAIRKHGLYAKDELLENPDLAIEVFTKLKEERQKRKALEAENARQKQIIGEYQPKVSYYDIILNNKGLVTITQIAKDYGMSGQAMNKLLHQYGIQYEQSGQWLLYAKYHNEGYTHSQTIPITHKNGTKDVTMQTKWTQKGRLFLYDLLKKSGIFPMIERPDCEEIA